MADVTLTVDGKQVRAPAGTLLIEACKSVGVEVPSFCYYPGVSLQGACRMCLVEIAKIPKLQTACTVPVTEGMAVITQSDTVKQARKAMLEFVPAEPSAGLPGMRCRRAVRTTGCQRAARNRLNINLLPNNEFQRIQYALESGSGPGAPPGAPRATPLDSIAENLPVLKAVET